MPCRWFCRHMPSRCWRLLICRKFFLLWRWLWSTWCTWFQLYCWKEEHDVRASPALIHDSFWWVSSLNACFFFDPYCVGTCLSWCIWICDASLFLLLRTAIYLFAFVAMLDSWFCFCIVQWRTLEIQILTLLFILLIITRDCDFDGKLAGVQLDDYCCIASVAMICSTMIILTSSRF